MSQASPFDKRRDKPVLSCTFCRGRKLRCDRQSPCSNCIKRFKPEDCLYASSVQERRDAIDYRPYARSQQARQRLARLEAEVTRLRDETSAREQASSHASREISPSSGASHSFAATTATFDEPLSDTMGNLSINGDHEVYTGSSHWVAILEDIQSLKDELAHDDDLSTRASHQSSFLDANEATTSSVPNISLLTGLHTKLPAVSREEILAMVPLREVADRHVFNFFNAFSFAPSILHRDRFFAEYNSFWEQPAAAPINWLGLLFSVMTISAFLQRQDVALYSPYLAEIQGSLRNYRSLTIQCLNAGNYLEPNRHSLETLVLHFTVEQKLHADTSINSWMLIGTIVRSALRMGLHRDPSHWPSIRPLDAEYRRRLWMVLYTMDFFTSTQVGLPRMIKDSQCDTHTPANLYDDDLSIGMDKMPPERAMTEPTPISLLIQRSFIINVTAEIYDATEAGPPDSTTLASLGAKLANTINSIPKQFRYQSLGNLLAESPVNILQRIALDILIHKAMYLLHRRSFVKSVGERHISESHNVCIDAALAILEHQQRLSQESQPGGILSGIRWKVASSLNHEFLQATMMLCFALSRHHRADLAPLNAGVVDRCEDIIAALRGAETLWRKQSDRSVEARRAASAISKVLQQEHNKSDVPDPGLDGGTGDPERPQQTTFDWLAGHPQSLTATLSTHSSVGPGVHQALGADDSFQMDDVDMAVFTNLWDDLAAESEIWPGTC